jgi:RNA helicase
LLIYGPSGSGKSRIVFEIIKDKKNVLDTSVEKVYIINPRQKTGEKTGRTTLIDLLNQVTENDIIVWDNFPTDLIKRDKDSASKALE